MKAADSGENEHSFFTGIPGGGCSLLERNSLRQGCRLDSFLRDGTIVCTREQRWCASVRMPRVPFQDLQVVEWATIEWSTLKSEILAYFTLVGSLELGDDHSCSICLRKLRGRISVQTSLM